MLTINFSQSLSSSRTKQFPEPLARLGRINEIPCYGLQRPHRCLPQKCFFSEAVVQRTSIRFQRRSNRKGWNEK